MRHWFWFFPTHLAVFLVHCTCNYPMSFCYFPWINCIWALVLQFSIRHSHSVPKIAFVTTIVQLLFSNSHQITKLQGADNECCGQFTSRYRKSIYILRYQLELSFLLQFAFHLWLTYHVFSFNYFSKSFYSYAIENIISFGLASWRNCCGRCPIASIYYLIWKLKAVTDENSLRTRTLLTTWKNIMLL